MTWPVRTGLTSMHDAAEKIAELELKFRSVQAGILSPDQLTKIANLIQCIADFLADVPSHEPPAQMKREETRTLTKKLRGVVTNG